MKVELALLSLILIVSCSAQKYELKCTENEKDILWPIYSNNALYLRCAETGKSLEMKCNAGTVFAFVYQGCVMPDDYIPPPPVDSLPLDNGSPCDDTTPSAATPSPGTIGTTKPQLPTPQHPPITEKPPTEKTTKPTKPTTENPPTAPGPPTGSPAQPPTVGPPGPPTANPPGPPTPSHPTAGPNVPGPPSPPATGVPMPNTPAPTPPVIDNVPPNVGVTLPSN